MPVYSSLGTKLQVTITSVLTDIVGVRDVEFEAPELEMMEVDDIASTHVDMDPTGRSKGGSVKASAFYDPAAATTTALLALFNAPVKTSGVFVPTVWAIVWQGATAVTQGFSGTLTKQTRKAERGSPLMADLEITVSRKPTLV
jgi:hypothetical protein